MFAENDLRNAPPVLSFRLAEKKERAAPGVRKKRAPTRCTFVRYPGCSSRSSYMVQLRCNSIAYPISIRAEASLTLAALPVLRSSPEAAPWQGARKACGLENSPLAAPNFPHLRHCETVRTLSRQSASPRGQGGKRIATPTRRAGSV